MDSSADLSHIPLGSVHADKSMLRDLIKLLNAALPDTHFSKIIALIRHFFEEEESHHAQQLVFLMNRLAQVRLLEHLDPRTLQHQRTDMVMDVLNMNFEIHHLQLRHNFWMLCIESDRPDLERLIRSLLPLSHIGSAFQDNGFEVGEHHFWGVNLMMIVDRDPHDPDEEALLLVYPHLHLAIQTSWSRLHESLNPYFHPSMVYSQSHLLEGHGLFHHHELLLMVLHLLAASQLGIEKEMQQLHESHWHVQHALSW